MLKMPIIQRVAIGLLFAFMMCTIAFYLPSATGPHNQISPSFLSLIQYSQPPQIKTKILSTLARLNARLAARMQAKLTKARGTSNLATTDVPLPLTNSDPQDAAVSKYEAVDYASTIASIQNALKKLESTRDKTLHSLESQKSSELKRLNSRIAREKKLFRSKVQFCSIHAPQLPHQYVFHRWTNWKTSKLPLRLKTSSIRRMLVMVSLPTPPQAQRTAPLAGGARFLHASRPTASPPTTPVSCAAARRARALSHGAIRPRPLRVPLPSTTLPRPRQSPLPTVRPSPSHPHPTNSRPTLRRLPRPPILRRLPRPRIPLRTQQRQPTAQFRRHSATPRRGPSTLLPLRPSLEPSLEPGGGRPTPPLPCRPTATSPPRLRSSTRTRRPTHRRPQRTGAHPWRLLPPHPPPQHRSARSRSGRPPPPPRPTGARRTR